MRCIFPSILPYRAVLSPNKKEEHNQNAKEIAAKENELQLREADEYCPI